MVQYDQHEIRDVLKKQKDNKFRGTAEIQSEQFKYSTSNSLVAALWLLISMIWTKVAILKLGYHR